MSLSSSLKLVVRAHPGQLEALRSEAFCVAPIAGTGGGKTSIARVWLVKEMAKRPGMLWLWAEPVSDMVDRIALTTTAKSMSVPDFLKWFDRKQVFLSSKGLVRNRLGTVAFVSAHNPDSWQGGHLGGAVLDEAGLMKREAFETALQRVGLSGGSLFLPTTPYNMGWLKTDVADRAKDGDKDYHVVRFPSLANPAYPREAVERARRTMSPARFAMMYEGEFGRPEGMVYDCWDVGRHVVDDFAVPADWYRVGGVDFGYNDPTAGVWLARNGDGVWYWYREHYRRGATLSVHARALGLNGGRGGVWYADPSGAQQQAELRRHGLRVRDADNDVQAGIDTVYELLMTDRLRVFRSCKHGLDEVEGYVWKRDRGGFTDEPVKERDHLMDALRYALHSVEKRPRVGLRV